MNIVHGELTESGEDGLDLKLGSQTLRVDKAVFEARPDLRGYLGRPLGVGIRPEDMEDATLMSSPDNTTLRSTADLVEAMGSDVLVHFVLDAPMVVTDDTKELARDVGTDVLGALDEAGKTDMIARFSPRTAARHGEPVTVHVATDRLHYFDPETGLSIWGDETPKSTGETPS
jgi:multiple sugar transport system ATP-binding protein